MPKKRLSRILILFCGGTVAMEQLDDEGGLGISSRAKTINALLNLKSMLSCMSNIDLEYVFNVDSTNMSPDLWDKIADAISSHYDEYDGFVVIHGTDTMAYTTSALSFVLKDLGKPVVFTGAQIPAYWLETDARRNLINAVRVANMDLAGVFLVFDKSIILGARASKITESGLQAFQSMNAPPVGEIRVHMTLRSDYRCKRHKKALALAKGFETNVAVVSLHPGMPAKILTGMLDDGIKGFVVRGYGTGNVPDEVLEFFEKARARKIPVVVNTQCIEGRTLMHLYDVGQQALNFGAIQAHDMSVECATTKLMWALGQGVAYSEIEAVMHQDFVGEIDDNA